MAATWVSNNFNATFLHTQQCYEIKLQTFKLCYMQNLFLNYIICHLKIKELSNYVRFYLHMKAYFKENNYSPVYAVNTVNHRLPSNQQRAK